MMVNTQLLNPFGHNGYWSDNRRLKTENHDIWRFAYKLNCDLGNIQQGQGEEAGNVLF